MYIAIIMVPDIEIFYRNYRKPNAPPLKKPTEFPDTCSGGFSVAKIGNLEKRLKSVLTANRGQQPNQGLITSDPITHVQKKQAKVDGARSRSQEELIEELRALAKMAESPVGHGRHRGWRRC